MNAHENLTTRDKSVKRGGGSVMVVEIHRTPFMLPRDQLFLISKCFREGIPHRCVKGIICVPGCESLS